MKAQRPNSLSVPAAGESDLWTSQGDGEVKLRISDSGLAAEKPLTINEMFTSAVERFGDFKALSWKEGEQQKSIDYREYYQICRTAAKSFLKVDSCRMVNILSKPDRLRENQLNILLLKEKNILSQVIFSYR